MTRLRVSPIVEGQGEEQSIRILLQRVWTEVAGGTFLEVLKPIRGQRHALAGKNGLHAAVKYANLKLSAAARSPSANSSTPGLILIVLDADKELPCELAPRLMAAAKKETSSDVVCVIANVEFETWFVASAESLGSYLNLGQGEAISDEPERHRLGKGWIKRHFNGPKYSEPVDQPRMTAKMDLKLCRSRSPSFDKLCRELEQRLAKLTQV